MAAVVGDVDRRPRGPGRGLFKVGTWQSVARLVLLQAQKHCILTHSFISREGITNDRGDN